MTFTVRFMTLSGKFATAKTEQFATSDEVLAAVRAYVEPHGFTNVKLIDTDDDGMGDWRITARTPGGRGGRNVAFVELRLPRQS